MSMKWKLTLVAVPLSAVALVGCGSSTSSGGSPTSSSASASAAAPTSTAATTPSALKTGTGEYGYTPPSAGGGTVRLNVYAPSSANFLSQLEAYRAATKQPAVSYISVELDNTGGTAELDVPDISIVSSDGSTTEYESADQAVSAWGDAAGIDQTDLYNRGVDLHNQIIDTLKALPGAKTETLLVATSTPKDVHGVFATDSGSAIQLTKTTP